MAMEHLDAEKALTDVLMEAADKKNADILADVFLKKA